MHKTIHTDVAIIGAGTAGLYALREVRRANKQFVLIDKGPLGTTCARVGCMPSKLALHAGAVQRLQENMQNPATALDTDKLNDTWAGLQKQRDFFAARACNMAISTAQDNLLTGTARFLNTTTLEVSNNDQTTLVYAKKVIIANGSRPAIPAWLDPVLEYTVSTDELFELKELPASIGILGLGAIGMEMGLALSRLGIKVVGADLSPAIAGIADPQINEQAIDRFSQEMELWLGQPTSVSQADKGVLLQSGARQARVDLLLAALGRRPNLDSLNLQEAGFPLNDKGIPSVNPHTMQVTGLPVFLAGDCTGSKTLMHEASAEGSIAGFNAVQDDPVCFKRMVSLGIAFSDPDIFSVGASQAELASRHIITGKAEGGANGRARILHEESSLLHIYADPETGTLLGAAGMAPHAEHLAHLLAWAIQRKETAVSLLQMPFYHPVLEEMIQSALQDIVRQMAHKPAYPFGLIPVTCN
ncbi:MAG: dihydrolipoyl dehydrogenase [Advenella sp.]